MFVHIKLRLAMHNIVMDNTHKTTLKSTLSGPKSKLHTKKKRYKSINLSSAYYLKLDKMQ